MEVISQSHIDCERCENYGNELWFSSLKALVDESITDIEQQKSDRKHKQKKRQL